MDSDGDSGGKIEKLSRLSEDAFDSEKVSAKRSSNYVVLKCWPFCYMCRHYVMLLSGN